MLQLKRKLTITLLCVFALLMSACASYSAKRQIEKGNYVDALSVMVTDLNKKGRFTSERHKEKTITIMQTALQQIEAMPRVTATQQTKRFEQLLKAYQLLAKKFFSSEFSVFLNRYSVSGLRTDVAKGYYQQAMEVPEVSHYAYREKALLFAKGAEFFNYNNMQALSREYAKKYALAASEIEYQQALINEKNGNFKLAAELLAKVKVLFQEYGEYKDTSARFIKNDKAWRVQEMNQALQTANNLATQSSKASNRKASAWYIYADDVNKPYGGNPQARRLADEAWARGVITVGYQISKLRSSSGDDVARKIASKIENVFSESYFLTRPNSRGDITINITYDMSYQESSGKVQKLLKNYTDAEGKSQSYVQLVQDYSNQVELIVSLESYGEISVNKKLTYTQDSVDQTIGYSGAAPSGVSTKNAKLKTKSYLENKVMLKMENDLGSHLRNIESSASRL